MIRKISCSIVRGGTSKAVFLRDSDLPPAGPARDAMIKSIMGTPDVRQINGLGGADILTSKVAILGPPTISGTDVDFTFAQVGIADDVVSYDGGCGNISAAVGPMAIDFGFVEAGVDEFRKIRIHDHNSGGVIIADVPVLEGRAQSEGEFPIAGVPGSGARITIDMADMVGGQTGKLFPLGSPQFPLQVPGFATLDVSLVDLANPVLMVRATQLGLSGCELPDELEADGDRIELLEKIRSVAAQRLGFASDFRNGFTESPYIPFFCFIGPAHNYTTLAGQEVADADCDLVARLVGFKKTHKAFPGTGAACLAVASRIEGTVPYELLSSDRRKQPTLRIGHPSGVFSVDVGLGTDGLPCRAAYDSTWRKIMDGTVYI